jgi:hypothetical protein
MPSDDHRVRLDRQLLFSDGQTVGGAGPTACPWDRGPRPYFGYMQMCSCNDGETFSVNTVFCDSTGENIWLDLNRDTLPHDYF